MTIQKPHNLGHYWRLKAEWEVLSREAKKKADKLANTEYAWEALRAFPRSRGFDQLRQKKANEVRDLEHDWARLKGKLAKITKVLAPFDDTYREIKIEGLDNGR